MRQKWWLLPLGLLIALLALATLLRGGPTSLPRAEGPPPMDEIDEASRERLEEVLREAEDD